MFRNGFYKTAKITASDQVAATDEKDRPGLSTRTKILAPLLAGGAAYLGMRRYRALPKNAPKGLRALREAAQEHGFTRVHVDNKPKGPIGKFVRELFVPADNHKYLVEGKSFMPGQKTKAAVFDPNDMKVFKTPNRVGYEDRLTRKIERSKLDEYQLAMKAGLTLPKTERLKNVRSLRPHEIAKPLGGSQSRVPITARDVHNYDKNSLALKNFKALKRRLSRSVSKKEIASEQVHPILNHHPGYKDYLVEQALKHPKKFVRQPRIDIDSEFRVHTLQGKSIGATSNRHAFGFGGHAEAERAAEKLLKNVDPKLKDNMLALDIAKDKRGKWHVIETNAGPGSGFLTPAAWYDFRGPHALYKAITGRYARSSSALGAAAAATGTAGATYAVDRHLKNKPSVGMQVGPNKTQFDPVV